MNDEYDAGIGGNHKILLLYPAAWIYARPLCVLFTRKLLSYWFSLVVPRLESGTQSRNHSNQAYIRPSHRISAEQYQIFPYICEI